MSWQKPEQWKDPSDLECNSEIGPILEIGGAPITNKEGMLLSIAAKREEFEIWQREKLMLKCSDFMRIDWEV